MTLQQIADEITKNPKLRVLFVVRNAASVASIVSELHRELDSRDKSLVELRGRLKLAVKGWDGRNPTVMAMTRTSSPAGYRLDLIVVESNGPWWPFDADEMNYRSRLVEGGRVEFFSWDGEPK